MKKKYYFSIASVFKNESWILKEWIEHYKFHGADHIYLVNDFSTDNYLHILKPYINYGFVTLYQNDIKDYYLNRQIDINNKFFKPVLNETQWLAQVDLDEFLYSPKEIDIKIILKKYIDYSAIISNWVYFGSNGHEKQPKYVVEGFTKRHEYDSKVYMKPAGLPEQFVTFAGEKVIVNSNFEVNSFNIHDVDINGIKINLSYKTRSEPEILINHYQLQSKEYWEKIKMGRDTDVNNWFPEKRSMYEHKIMDISSVDDFGLYEQNEGLFYENSIS